MDLRTLVDDLVNNFEMDRYNCVCAMCADLRPQVTLIRAYLKTRRVSEGLMHAITDKKLKRALIEEICLHTLNTKEE